MHLYISQLLFVLAYFRIFILTESARNELIPLVNITNACPGDVLMYQCNIVGSGNTIWTGTAFNDCSNNEIILRHSTFASGMAFGNCNGGAISARGLGVDNNCYSSQLNVTVNSDLNNKTIRCDHSSDTVVTIRTVTLSVATVPPMNVKLAEVSPGELVFNWTTSAGSPVGLYYIVNSTCGICPNMTSATMVTCSNLNLSTITTICTFSVRSAVCGTTGSPSTQVAVTLGVPDVPNVAVIPQYSLNDGQLLTKVIVHINQTVNTSFPIADAISGSTTSYGIFYSENNMLNVTPCVNSTCKYIIDVPSSICSMSANVDITIAAANRLGVGPPSEPITVGCTNRFVRVSYDPTNMTISCTFENRLDSSPKSCSVKYGTCGQEMYTTQGNTIDEFIIRLKLNSSIASLMNCYVVTASNGTYDIMVNGSLNLAMREGANNAVLSVIVVPVVGLVVGAIIIVIGVIFGKRRWGGKANVVNEILEMEEQCTQSENLHRINSKHFIKSTITNECTLKEFCKNKNIQGLVFLEYRSIPRNVKICDVILQNKDGELYTGPDARNMVNNEQDLSMWENVFVLPLGRRNLTLKSGTSVLHQNPQEIHSNFEILFVKDNDTHVSDFMKQSVGSQFESGRVFYEFSSIDRRFSLLHYLEVIIIDDSKLQQLKDKDTKVLDCGIHFFYTKLKAPGETIKHPGKKFRVFVQGTSNLHKLKPLMAGSLVLYKVAMTADDHK